MCKNCVHYEICCNEGRDDEALIFCADFFEVVRCKDCKHAIEHNEKVYECDCFCAMTTPNFYCADGERKETE